MKIAIDIEPIGSTQAGIGHYVQNLILGLAKIDQINTYLLYCRQKPGLSLPDNFQFRVVSTPDPFWHLSVLKDLKKSRVDLYHSTHSVQIPALGRGFKKVLTVHDLSALTHPQWHNQKVGLLGKLLPRAIRSCERILVPTEAIKDELIQHFGQAEKIVVTPEAADKIYSPGGSRVSGQLAYIGTLEPRKNIIRILEALSLLSDLPLCLKIAGKKGWGYDEIFRLVQKLKLTGRVQFMGYISQADKIQLLRQSEVFVFPSLYEGFGLPVLEAMSAGAPVVTSNQGALKEVAGGAAQLVDPLSASSIADGIREIITTQGRAGQLSELGIKRAQDFSWEQTASLTLKAYETC